jgi:hypothetical protein
MTLRRKRASVKTLKGYKTDSVSRRFYMCLVQNPCGVCTAILMREYMKSSVIGFGRMGANSVRRCVHTDRPVKGGG